ncbi:hypothetical protein OS175_04105 [Marinicella sp. S1101]|uniref:hypothetical protein n=1 Tax=Marinicella marina TaxID=2996016 RepID=UPI002260E5CC|nr:hypothetical protein [Marinicella marina]MCX7553050.1 hypothetical protein [Marinicella marina]MDJ1139590.1 hypothetical protein [Marinicella marina]
MLEGEAQADSSIIKVMCATCHNNTIYLKFMNPENNQKPFKADQYICTECHQGLTPSIETAAD